MTRLLLLLALASLACGFQALIPITPHPTIEATRGKKSVENDTDVPAVQYTVCRASGLSVRVGPGEWSQRTDYLESGTEVTATETRTAADGGRWAYVEYDSGRRGWVNARYLCQERAK